jgi:hypothetical protein
MPDSIKHGDRVRVHLYTREGLLIGSIEGTASDFSPNTEVAPGVRKNLIWVTGIEGYERPNELGQSEPADEGWFADTDVEKIDEGQPRFFSN